MSLQDPWLPPAQLYSLSKAVEESLTHWCQKVGQSQECSIPASVTHSCSLQPCSHTAITFTLPISLSPSELALDFEALSSLQPTTDVTYLFLFLIYRT